MWAWTTSFVAGYACRSHCGGIPCRARLSSALGGRPFKISVFIHSANLAELDGPGLVQDQRPSIGIRHGDKMKETELGDWSKEKGQWCFREIMTLEVSPCDELTLVVTCSTRYSLWLATVSLTSRRLGEACFPVSAVISKLKMQDRDTEGLVYASPIMPFDVIMQGKNAGRVYLSFETNQAPPAPQKIGGPDGWCAFSSPGQRYERGLDGDDTDLDNSCRSSSAGSYFMPAGARY